MASSYGSPKKSRSPGIGSGLSFVYKGEKEKGRKAVHGRKEGKKRGERKRERRRNQDPSFIGGEGLGGL